MIVYWLGVGITFMAMPYYAYKMYKYSYAKPNFSDLIYWPIISLLSWIYLLVIILDLRQTDNYRGHNVTF